MTRDLAFPSSRRSVEWVESRGADRLEGLLRALFGGVFLLCLVTSGLRAQDGPEKPNEDASRATRPLILLTNDDGIDSPGLQALVPELESIGDLLVVAPSTDASGSAQSLTFRGTIGAREVERSELGPVGAASAQRSASTRAWAVAATPASCVVAAVTDLAGDRPVALVVSGINGGPNIGLDVTLSGTVGAARMGSDLGIPSIAVSRDRQCQDLEGAARLVGGVARELLARAAGRALLVNINVPRGTSADWPAPVVTSLGGRGVEIRYARVREADGSLRLAPRLGRYSGEYPVGSDGRALAEGRPSITPIAPFGADARLIEELRAWSLSKRPAGSTGREESR